ncbi:glycoside hydrolase family 19 protein [Asticcacaulis excentricus]|uniref:Carboxypeptidase n=1 Tax=Asticcacaulis excentricus TaxID=78587 RepID=A0A3G9G3N7_9CAUL|nr:glycoside hydrolase family 19 protein [Asticcacaulis excentricus]BBF79673.1 carboxypeptidase [Asticcacaulis excentricus]
MAGINRKHFFDTVRTELFGGKITPSQMQGLTAILDKWETDASHLDDRWLAYMLATAFHETARTMQPVRETRASTDEAAIIILEKAFIAGNLPWVKKPYWRKDAEGKSWLGRGLVQITHKANYIKLGTAIGVNLVANPSLALDMDVALKIMFTGMIDGLFTGKRLADFFHGNVTDWKNARKIINGLESADLVAGHAAKFYMALSYTV